MDRNSILNDPETAMRYSLDGRQSQIWTSMPAIVQSVDFPSMTLQAQPSIMGVQTNPDDSTTYVKLPLLVDVPIIFPSAGGFTLTLPIKLGDEILVMIASRCIDSWWQTGAIGIPMEARMHDLSDGFAIPGPKSLPKAILIPNISSTNAELRTNDGLTKISITPLGAINMTAPLGVTINGNLAVTGSIVAPSVASASIVSAGKVLATHEHPVTTAPGTTGPPV